MTKSSDRLDAPATRTESRPRRRPVDKFSQRRGELADAALATLAELGYSRTSLREIANTSGYTHGVLHYYFADKTELITYCVRRYKAFCVHRYDEVIESAEDPDGLATGLADTMVATVIADGPFHRLWYDLRDQAMYEPGLRTDVEEIDITLLDMIGRVIARYAELSGRRPVLSPGGLYSAFDGVFQRYLVSYLGGDLAALEGLRQDIPQLLAALVPE